MGPLTSRDVKDQARKIGFHLVGITTVERLKDLPRGNVHGVKQLIGAADELPTAKSAIILAFHIWDPIFNVMVSEPGWRGYGMHPPDENFSMYQLYSEIVRGKAGQLVDYLREQGFQAKVARGIPLKPAAVIAGLGCRGKNTILVTPQYGSRVRLAAVLTSAELEPDEPFREDLCRSCERCIAACPTKALKPYDITISRCLTYAAENPESPDVASDVRDLERKLIMRPTPNSFIECTICIDACPIGRETK